MILDSLPQPHLMFARLSILRISHELLVLKNLGMVAADALLPHRFVHPRLLIVLGIGEARHLAGAVAWLLLRICLRRHEKAKSG